MDYLNFVVEIIEEYNSKGYLVGGVVRDYLLQRDVEDIDIGLKAKVGKIARNFADRIKGSFIILDKKREIYRVVKAELVYDFTLIKGDSIREDLRARDFTINSMALELSDVLDIEGDSLKNKVIDPYGGIDDLEKRLIRATQERVFAEDPLRLFRAVRFKAALNFNIDKGTEELMKKFNKGIDDIAKERIKEELLKILSCDGADQHLAYLEEKLGLLSQLVPGVERFKETGQCRYHREDLWEHSIYGVKKVEELLEEEFWRNKVDDKRISLLKLGVLLHDIGKLSTEREIDGEVHFYGHDKAGANYLGPILKRLRFSREEISYIKALVRYHMRPLALYYAHNLTNKGRYRFFNAGGDWVLDICLVAAADAMSSRELNDRKDELPGAMEFLKDLIRRDQKVKTKTEDLLLSGRDIIDIFGIKEGPTIGKLLNELREKQALEEIKDRQEAIEYLRDFLEE
ncbi:CCA tRNA nucleotidyltransferase [Halonatronum saccharophilum]|uniref:CCA tRNA nucleotidyltransferase n=1 Tax=Halonatronum saccharophilum TaxID=150060 RepID=UPI0004890614|nr:HD domain-containing protein [Halonatronum saccharophilum]